MWEGGIEMPGTIIKTGIIIWLLILSYEDIRLKTVPLWQLAGLGVFCVINEIIRKTLPEFTADSCLAGAFIGAAILLFSILTDMIGKGDGIVFVCLGVAFGGMELIRIVLLSLGLICIAALILIIFKKVKKKTRLAFMPYIFLAVLGVVLCG
jgi:leader peptidase (prepilin peptidase)/N-methyltransferase